jgi:hypothetical protein
VVGIVESPANIKINLMESQRHFWLMRKFLSLLLLLNHALSLDLNSSGRKNGQKYTHSFMISEIKKGKRSVLLEIEEGGEGTCSILSTINGEIFFTLLCALSAKIYNVAVAAAEKCGQFPGTHTYTHTREQTCNVR